MAQNNSRLWYNAPAELWTDALPIGNGKLGAMIFGIPDQERIQINEESIWSGGPMMRVNQNAAESVTAVRQLLIDGQISEAQKLANLGIAATPQGTRNYETGGDLEIYFDGTSEPDNGTYERWLDLETATAGVRFAVNGSIFERELFSSAPDNVIVHRMTSDNGSLSFQMRLNRQYQLNALNVVYDKVWGQDGDTSVLTGSTGGANGIRYTSAISVDVRGGNVTTLGNFIVVEGADEAIAYLAIDTSFRSADPTTSTLSRIAAARSQPYEVLRQRHIEDYQAIYNRTSITLGPTNATAADLPTNLRLNATQNGTIDTGLIELQFQYGRYMLISSSRPGTLPANLQGIWNKDFDSIWGSKFTININTQMNYWPAEIAGMSETQDALFDLIERLRVSGSQTARQMYNASGWVSHHNTDIWADTAPQDRNLPSTYWALTSGWLCLHLLEHYHFTRDTTFLITKMPTIIESIQFYLDFLKPYSVNDTSYLITNPTCSPENNFRLSDTENGTMTFAATIDNQILRELFTKTLQAHNEVTSQGVDSPLSADFVSQIESALPLLPPTRIGERYNTIMEWFYDYEEAEPGHRHVSHLFGLYPGSQITAADTPELFEGAKRTLERRLANGGAGTGWSRAWTLNFYARLLNGSAVEKNIFEFFDQSVYPNLFDAHPPFQADGNYGFTAGVVESLLQSHFEDGMVWVLPALPPSWTEGELKGVTARGGFVLDLAWRNSVIESLNVTSPVGRPLLLRYADNGTDTVTVSPGGDYDGYQDYGNGTFTLNTAANGKYEFRFSSG